VRKTVAMLLIAGTIVTPFAIGALWVRYELLDTNRYVSTVTPLASNPAIVSAVSDRITTTLLDQVDAAEVEKEAGILGPLVGAGAHDAVQAVVEKFLLTAEFTRLWALANRQAHEALVAALEGNPSPLIQPDGSVDLNLSDIVASARHDLVNAGFTVFEHVQPGLVEGRYTIATRDTLRRARHVYAQEKTLSVALPAAAIALFGLALLISRERRRTLVRAGIGIAVAGGAGLVAVLAGRWYYLNDAVGPTVPADAARAFYDIVIRDLRRAFEITGIAGLGVAAVGLVAGPSRTATRVRGATLRTAGAAADRAVGDSATHGWVAANKSLLRLVTVLAGLVVVAGSQRTLNLVVGVAVVVLLVLGFIEILARPRRGGVP
jgi:hypothetical protein